MRISDWSSDVCSSDLMLPNHAPLMVAEQYGTLAAIHGDRIDLGLGRAPGTDMMTAQALSRSSAEPQAFARSIFDLQGWFGDTGKIGSASCRERGCQYVWISVFAVSLKKKIEHT